MSEHTELKINPNRKFLRPEKLPHFFCSGCGCGQVLNYYTQALDELGMDPEKMVHIAGVGCTARIPVYIKTDMFHGVHGRTLAWATGVKLMQPDTPVVIFAGDGDIASIGGNHLIHAARRNLDVTVVMVNNLNFAMTGGQVAPTTPEEVRTMTTPYGNEEPRFDVCELAKAAGASHVERWSTAKPVQCKQAFKRALQHKGFSLISRPETPTPSSPGLRKTPTPKQRAKTRARKSSKASCAWDSTSAWTSPSTAARRN